MQASNNRNKVAALISTLLLISATPAIANVSPGEDPTSILPPTPPAPSGTSSLPAGQGFDPYAPSTSPYATPNLYAAPNAYSTPSSYVPYSAPYGFAVHSKSPAQARLNTAAGTLESALRVINAIGMISNVVKAF